MSTSQESNVSGSKRKAAAVAESSVPAPPLNFLMEYQSLASGESEDDWRRLREAGLLDMVTWEQKDRQAHIDKIFKLERELYDYQHHMGILLIEKKAWNSSFEEIRQELAEVQDSLSKVKEREDTLRKALGVEKQCVTDLIEALLDMEEKKSTLDAKEKKLLSLEEKITVREREVDSLRSILDTKEKKLLSLEEKLTVREREIDSLKSILDAEEKKLLSLEEKLTVRERVEIPKLIDDQRVILDIEKQEIELELENKRKSLDEEIVIKVSALEQQEVELNHKEEKLGKREQALDRKSERVEEKEKDFEARLKSVIERETSVKAEEKRIEMEKQQLIADKESLHILKDETVKQQLGMGKSFDELDTLQKYP